MSNADANKTYAQLRFSRNDGRTFSTGVAGMGAANLEAAREMARTLAASPACDVIEVVVETRDGAITSDTSLCVWTRSKGWVKKK